MKNKNLITTVMLMAFLLFSVSLVAGAITSNTPATAGDTVTGTYVFNATTALAEAYNCTWATTADGVFAITANSTADQTEFTNSTDTTALTDAEDTTITITCTNSTGSTETKTLTINVDNTAPVCSFAVDVDVTEILSAGGVQTTQQSTDTTDLTYAWTLYDPNGNSKTTSTSASPNFLLTDFDQIGDYKIGLTVTDEASKSTACTNRTIMVSGNDDGTTDVVVGGTTTTTTTGGDNTIIIVMIVVLVIIILAVGLYFVIGMSKKRR